MSRPHVLMVFLDGVGIGTKDAARNPFYAADFPTLRNLLGGEMLSLRRPRRESSAASCVPINATLGIPGLPQSGTGQTALLTGLNAAKMIGKHFGPYPYSTLKPVLAEKGIFARLDGINLRSMYVNAFPRQYFEYIVSTKTRSTAITLSWMLSGHKLNNHETLFSGKALSADLTNERWHRLGYPDMPVITPQQAGKRLVSLAYQHDFVLYEFYMTDHAGHSQSMPEAISVLTMMDQMLEGILDAMDHRSMLFIMTSDHGNLEDLSVKTHTRNPVPLLALGNAHRQITERARTLTDVVPALMKIFNT